MSAELIIPKSGIRAQHSSASNEHYTPANVLHLARQVMGGIDLDPASTQSVNDSLVHAKEFYDIKRDGLKQIWNGSVWLNPPGGRVGRCSSAAVWWAKLCHEYQRGTVTQAIFLGFSVELLATSQDCDVWPGHVQFCIPRRRIRFLREREGVLVSGDKPTHSNIILFLPPAYPGYRRKYAQETFRDRFSSIGKVSSPQ